MTAPIFYTLPGDEAFAPAVAHPGEDAGADIKAYIKNGFNKAETISFYSEFKGQSPTAHAAGKGHLYIDGQKTNRISRNEFLALLEGKDGGIFLRPCQTALVETGFKVALPANESTLQVYAIVPRSGLACKHNITVTNSPGIVDAGYRDWVKVSLTNLGKDYHVFTHGARIAQGLIWSVYDQSQIVVTTDETLLTKSKRSTGGFGSTSV